MSSALLVGSAIQKKSAMLVAVILLAMGAVIWGCNSEPAPAAPPALSASAQKLAAEKERGVSFPDFGFMVTPAEYLGKYSDQPIFRLKADFPKEKPQQVPAFMEKIDFKKNPLEYLVAARDYSFEGNLPNWDPFENKTRPWYHIPWLHPTQTGDNAYPPNGGTEGFRGLIKEAPVTPYQLGPQQAGKDGGYSIYAITLVNDMAGYTMGKMWADPNNPDPRATDSRYGGGFPVGTVFAKLLFTDAPQGTDKIDYLVNPLQWKAYITENFWNSSTRKVTAVNLLQMDIAVRDARADAPGLSGWVFGTFIYNGQLNNQNKFLNLVPVGLMWGDDPNDRKNVTSGTYPVLTTTVNPELKETAIFNTKELPPQHLGWNGRLNGPADLNTTSCMGCHIAAEYPPVTSLVPPTAVPDGQKDPPAKGGTDEWMRWFQNTRCATPMNEHAYSTDFSFQVAIALENFFNVKSNLVQGYWAADYQSARMPIARGELKPIARGNTKPVGKGKK
jgi:hypothetical protein